MKALLKINIDLPEDLKDGDPLKFEYDFDKASLIFPIEDWIMAFETDQKKVSEYNNRMKYFRENYISDKKLSKRFDGRVVEGVFRYYSRIDKIPIVEIDVSIEQLRIDKIKEILE